MYSHNQHHTPPGGGFYKSDVLSYPGMLCETPALEAVLIGDFHYYLFLLNIQVVRLANEYTQFCEAKRCQNLRCTLVETNSPIQRDAHSF